MTLLMRAIAAILLAVMCAAVPAAAAQSQPPKPTDEYVPVKELPPEDKLPAAPLLITAYSFVLIALFLYVVSVARRLTDVQRDIDRLGTTVKSGSKS